METRNTKTVVRQTEFGSTANFDGNAELINQRLENLLAVNRETASENSLYSSGREKLESELIKNPISTEKAYAYFGLLLGIFPPISIFLKMFLNNGTFRGEDLWIVGVIAVVSLISSIVGYFSGKLIGKTVSELEKFSWLNMLILLPFLGMLWGIFSGGAGGLIIFIFGAIFGAGLGALVGAAALPLFTIFHRLLKSGDMIERRQFLPIAFGVTFTICGFILGL